MSPELRDFREGEGEWTGEDNVICRYLPHFLDSVIQKELITNDLNDWGKDATKGRDLLGLVTIGRASIERM